MAGRLHSVLLRHRDQGIGRRAVERGWITPPQLEEALGSAEAKRLEQVLLERGWLTRRQWEDLRQEQRRQDARTRGMSGMPEEARAAWEDPSRRVSEYVLVSRVGRGGAAEVWKAWDVPLGRWVALKRPHPAKSGSIERFRREALAAARLGHPNIVPIYRVSEDEGGAFIVMRFIDGKTLDEMKLPIAQALRAVREAALAIHCAHERGVLHRDLKPENIMIDGDDHVWVLDFGLAHLSEASRDLTAAGAILGTPSFMSPEQARGEPATPLSDVYSLGATLYEVTTHRLPFDGRSMAEVVRQVAESEPPSPRRIDPKIPRDVETILLKAMEKEPRRRYPNARELAEDLRRYLECEPISARPASTVYRIRKALSKRKSLIVAGLAGLLGVGIVAGLLAPRWLQERAAVRRAEQEADQAERELANQREAELRDRRARGRAEAPLDAARRWLREFDLLSREAEDNPERARAAAEAAKKKLQEALREYPAHAEAHLEMGRLYEATGEWDRALECFDRAIHANPKFAMAYLERGLMHVDRYEELRHESDGSARTMTPEAVDLRARAEADLNHVRAWSEEEPELKYAEGMLDFAEGRFAEAADRLGEYVARIPGDARAWCWRGHALYHAERLEEAIEAFTAALRARPRMTYALLLRGICRRVKGDYAGAIADFDKVLEINPRHAGAYRNRGRARRLTADLKGAIEDYTRAIEIHPRLAEAYYNRGNARKESGDFEGAIEDFSEALEINPRYAQAYANRGFLREAMATRDPGDAEDLLRCAETDLARASEVAPTNWGYLRLVKGALARVRKRLAKLDREY
jgi:serine/threonine-protein kinase